MVKPRSDWSLAGDHHALLCVAASPVVAGEPAAIGTVAAFGRTLQHEPLGHQGTFDFGLPMHALWHRRERVRVLLAVGAMDEKIGAAIQVLTPEDPHRLTATHEEPGSARCAGHDCVQCARLSLPPGSSRIQRWQRIPIPSSGSSMRRVSCPRTARPGSGLLR